MALFRLTSPADNFPVIRKDGLVLRAPQMADYEAWAQLRSASRAFLEPWEPTWPIDDLTRSAFRRRIRRYGEEIHTDSAYPMFLFRQSDELLLGGLTLGLVRRGVAQACTLGYWMGQRHAGKGFMTSAVKMATRFAFADLSLRRIEAACLPLNQASVRLLEKAGFTREGYARRYLCIAGAWQDHILYARLKDDPIS